MRRIKNFILAVATVLAATVTMAQSGFNYQAVIRNAQGDLVAEKPVSLRISLMSGNTILYKEKQTATTNAYGVVSVVVGTGTPLSGSFSSIDWTKGNISMKTEFDPNGGTNYAVIGTTQLQAVPFSEYAKKTSAVVNPKDIQIQATSTTGDDEALFSVKDEEGNVVFAVYKSGVRVYVDDTDSGNKAAKSGFAVTGRKAKDGEPSTYFAVDNYGTQVYVDGDEDTGKAAKAKFAVTSVKKGKATTEDNVFVINEEGTKVFVDDEGSDKAAKAKFAVTSVKKGKDGETAEVENYLVVNKQGTQVYVDGDEDTGKAAKAKFAVTSVKKGKATTEDNVFVINEEGTNVFVDDQSDGKAAKAKFAVTSVKKGKDGESLADNYLVVNDEGTKVYVDGDDSKAAKAKFAVTSVRSGKADEADDFFLINKDGTQVFIDDEAQGKAAKAKFAVTSVKKGKGDNGDNPDYLVVDSDSTRVYIDNANSKAAKSGFAVTGKKASKGSNADMLKVTQDSTRIYVEGGSSKSGFGVEGKGDGNGKNGFAVTEKSANGNAGYMDVTAKNFFAGYNAGKNTISIYSDGTGKNNTFVGNNAGINNDYGSANVFMGYQAGYSLKGLSADENVYIGNRAGKNATSGQWSVVMGNDAGLYAGTINNSVIIGDRAGWGSNGTDYDRRSTFNSSVMIGSQAGWNYIKSSSNVFIGANVLNTVNELSGNVALGNSISVGGSDNTILGNGSAAIGTGNIIVGNGYGSGGYTDNNSIIIKTNSDDASADNYKNVSIGYKVGAQGTSNIAIGESAGGYSGSSNVYIGKNAGNANTGSNNINIGTGAGKGVNASNKLIISSLSNSDGVIAGTSTNALVYGEFNATTYKQTFSVNGAGRFNVARTSSTAENSTSLTALYAINDTYSNNVHQYGVFGETKAERSGYGYYNAVYGAATGGNTAYAVRGYAVNATNNYGLYGAATGGSAKNYGAYANGNGAGSSSAGVQNYGIYATATGNGYSSSYKNTNYGIYAYASGSNATNWAGYFNGDVKVTGALSLDGTVNFWNFITSSLVPQQTTYNLGTESNPWGSLHANNLYVYSAATFDYTTKFGSTATFNGSATFNGATTFTSSMSTRSIAPSVTASYFLGTTSNRWYYVYANNVDVTSDVYAAGNIQAKGYIYGSSTGGNLYCYSNFLPYNSSNDNIYLGNSSNRWYRVYAKYSENVSSDKRWKTNITNIDNALNKVLTLNGVTYNWRVNEFPEQHFDSLRHAGVIAQEVEAVLPEAVETDEQGFKSVTYDNLIPLLIEATKELKAEKDELKAEKDALEAKVDRLEKLVEELLKKQ